MTSEFQHRPHRVLLSGAWQGLEEVARLLAREDDLEVGHTLRERPEVVVHAVGDVDAIGDELTILRRGTSVPLVVVAREQSDRVLELTLATERADIVLVDAVQPAAARESIAFTIRKVLLARKHRAEHGPRARVFTVFSPKGGTGKSVTATNLAAALSRHRQSRVLLVDLDVQFGDVAIMLGLEPQRTIYDAAAAPGALDERKLATFTIRHSAGLDVLAAPERPEEAESLGEGRIASLLDVASTDYDAIVVDTSPYFHGPMLSALDRTDELLLLSGPDIPTLKNLRLVLGTLDQISFPLARINLVLNRAGERSALAAADVTTALDLPVAFELPYDPAVSQCVNRGIPAVLDDDEGPFAAAVQRMAAELVSRGGFPEPYEARRLRDSLGGLLLPRKKVLA
jgi:pilus assembly protein CpaE